MRNFEFSYLNTCPYWIRHQHIITLSRNSNHPGFTAVYSIVSGEIDSVSTIVEALRITVAGSGINVCQLPGAFGCATCKP